MKKVYTRVKTIVEKNGYPVGTVGVIVSFYESGLACEVELWDKDENPIDVVTYAIDELEEIEMT